MKQTITLARLIPALPFLLLTIHCILLLDGIRKNFVTQDELGHVPAGISHWELGNFRLYQVNPPLARMLAVLPVLAAQPTTDYHLFNEYQGNHTEWLIAHNFMEANRERYFDLIRLARFSGIVWSLLGGWLIYRWTRELYGAGGACLALALWCFGPNILAHAALATPDVPATVAGLAATYTFRHYLRDPSWKRAWLAGLLLGVAELTKFTLLILYIVWPVMWLASRCRRERTPIGIRRASAQGMGIILCSLFVINLGYGFRGTFRPLGNYKFASELMTGNPDAWMNVVRIQEGENRFRDGWAGDPIVPLPANYLLGMDEQRRDFEAGFLSYLRGEWRNPGWWYFYLYALAVKVPLGVWGLVFWSLALTLSRRPASASRTDELTLLLPVIVLLPIASCMTGFTMHMRYVLPIFPFVIIGTGKLGWFLTRERWKGGIVVVALVAWSAIGSSSIHPHYLSYFNEAPGGPNNGHKHLLSSNIDWGQDLTYLKIWLDDHPEARPLGLAYANAVDPRIAGIEFRLPPQGEPRPGYFAVSVNLVCGMEYQIFDGRGNRVNVPPHAYEYFQNFQPIGKAGYSIFIYKISP